jgi:predicted DNA-binding transcriptional regulator AlpA
VNQETWDTQQIAEYLQLSRRHVTEEVTKEPKFPKPVINRSRRNRRWDAAAVRAYVKGGEK